MNKLLHERLRDGDGAFIQLKTKSFTTSFHRDLAGEIADEIEKYYIPRPRFEDGEPVQVGDTFVQKIFDEETVLQKIGIALHGKLENMVWFPDEVVQRQEPKALDAKGVEIKVVETVWIIESGAKGQVEEINKDRAYVKCDDGWLADVHVSNLTHREPDSLEKLRDDMNYSIIEGTYPGTAHEYLCRCAKRLTAIMERDI